MSNCSTSCVCFFVQTAKFMLVVYNMIFNRPAGKSKNCVWPFLVEKQTERAPHASKSSKFIAFFFIRHWWFQCTSFIYIDPYLDTLSLQSTQIWMDGQNLFSIIAIFAHSKPTTFDWIHHLCYNANKKTWSFCHTKCSHHFGFVVFFCWE